MKNTRKILVSAFTLLIGMGVIGSTTGTIAWYQYSTRSHAAVVGTSAGASGNLKIKIKDQGEFVTRLEKEDIGAYLDTLDLNIQPITTGNFDKDDELSGTFYSNPIAGVTAYSNWKRATNKNYIVLPLQLCFREYDHDEEDYVLAEDKEIYLTDLLIQKDPKADEDLSDAIRVQLHTDDVDRLMSKNGGETLTNGKLDLDDIAGNDGYYQNDKYHFDDSSAWVEYVYGAGSQTSYAAELDEPLLIGDTGSTGVLDVTLTIWVEGWQELDGNSVWNKKFMDQLFDVGIEFATEVDE